MGSNDLALILILMSWLSDLTVAVKECKETKNGLEYIGTVNITKTGKINQN